ncbi:hypothetical protein TWF730_003194 [Orbilia blumenaviensis]|uniref:Uncharacterized protein n=1 Tax=Orbilia blumenaviensis TaxID=1796055 RepID=A0AAV9U4T8_9PEZI
MSQRNQYPFSGEVFPPAPWSPAPGAPIISSTGGPDFSVPFAPTSEPFPMFPGSPLPSPFLPATPAFGPTPMASPLPSAVSSAFSTPFGTLSAGSMPHLGPAPQDLDKIFGPAPNYVTANTSHLNLPFQPPPYKNFIPSPLYIEGSMEDLAYQNMARQNYANGLTTDPWRNEPMPQYIERFEDLSPEDQRRERALQRQYDRHMTDAQRQDMDRRRRDRTANYEPGLDEELWRPSPKCMCTIV